MDDAEPVFRVPDTGLPDAVFRRIASRAEFERLESSGEWFAAVPGYDGAWATGASQDAAREELVSVLRDWTAVRAHFHDSLPEEIDQALSLLRSR